MPLLPLLSPKQKDPSPIDYLTGLDTQEVVPGSQLWSSNDGSGGITTNPPPIGPDAGPTQPVNIPAMSHDTSSDLYGVQDALKADAQRRKFNADRLGDTTESGALKGLIDQYQTEQDTGDIGRGIAQNQAQEDADAKARMAGFGGNPTSPSGQAAAFQRNLDTQKATMPLQVEQYKANAERQMRQDAFKNMLRVAGKDGTAQGAGPAGGLVPMADGSFAPGASGPPPTGGSGAAPTGATPAGANPLTPSPNTAPYKSPTWHDILLGGPTAAKYGTLGDMLGAAGEYGKYLTGALPADNPFSDTMVNTSVANLKQIETMFPGIRGIATLIPLFQQHQGALGREMPAGTYGRIVSMLGILGDTDKSLDEAIGNNFTIGANGYPVQHVPPVAITRAKQMATDVRTNLERAKANMEQMYPGIGQPQNSGAPGNNPFADQQQPTGKQYLDDNGNPRR